MSGRASSAPSPGLYLPTGKPWHLREPEVLRFRVSPATSSCPPGTRWPAAQPCAGLWRLQHAASPSGHSLAPTHTCFSTTKAIPLTLEMSPVTPASRRGKQTDNSHQHHQIWGSGALGTVCPRRGVAPGPRRGWVPELLAARRSAACRQGPGWVGSSCRGAGRGGQGSDLRGAALGRGGPAPMETARDYAGALIRRVPPMCPCARVALLSEYSARLNFLCSPNSS